MNLRSIFVIATLITLSNARAAESLWTHQFTAESGFPTSIARSAEPKQKTLVMFWASWCLPCKGELAELSKRAAEFPANLKVIAVTTDDPSGLPQAQAFLASLHWPFGILRDNSGQFFYEYNHSGQLPYSVLLDEDGREIKAFQLLAESDIQEAFRLAGEETAGAGEPGKAKTRFGFRTEAVDFKGNNGVHNQLLTFTGYARGDWREWSGQVQYDYMYEERENPRTIVRGDEVGYSYLERRLTFGKSQGRIRAGDSHQAILAGELLSLQNIPNLTNPASLRGLSVQWDYGDWSLLAYGGEIHPALYASPINPTIALALPVVGERAEGASVFWHRDAGGGKNQINLNYVGYHRETNLGLGLAAPVDDQRLGAEFYRSKGKSGVQVRAAQFSTHTGVAGIDADKPYIIDPYVWWNFPGLEQQIYALHYIEYQSLPARTLTPVLVENPATPLQAAKIRSVRFSPKFFNKEETFWFEPIYIFEESIALLPYQRQQSYGFNLSFPKQDRKIVAFHQSGMLSPSSSYDESSLLATSPLYGPFSAQIILRHQNASPLDGDSDGLNLGWDVSKTWGLPFKGRLLVSGQWTRQSGYYYGFSGIARRDLTSGHIEWSEGVSTVRLGVGSEPGGIVCTNGVCVQKPPLNGANLEIAFSF